jgi:drug/metabolite transporter (DMT)-like permease
MFKYINVKFSIFTVYIAALLIISGFFCGSLQKFFVKSYLKQTEVFTIVFYQYFFGLIIYLPKIIKSRFQILITKKFPLIALRAMLGVIYWVGTFLSLKYITLLDTVFLTSMTPLWVPFLAYFFFSEKIDKKFYFLIIVGLLGVAFILMPDEKVFNFGGIPALISSIAWANSILLISQLTKTEKIETILIYYFLIASIITAPFVILNHTNLSFYQVSALAINAALMVLHQDLINRGYSYHKAYKLSILTYTNILFSGLFGIVFLNEIPNFRSLIGMLLIFYSCLYITLKFTKIK